MTRNKEIQVFLLGNEQAEIVGKLITRKDEIYTLEIAVKDESLTINYSIPWNQIRMIRIYEDK